MMIVSACLAGVNCRYDGENSFDCEVADIVERGMAIPVCPEQMGGCETPRPSAEIYGGSGRDVLEGKCRIITKDGEDLTEKFVRGAEETLKIALMAGCKKAILKSRSPSCGCGKIYDGTFSGKLVDGNGVTAQMLLDRGIKVEVK